MIESDKRMLEAKLAEMQCLADSFYRVSIRIGVHPFIEFTGLMNEYINMCRTALGDEIDFTQCSIHTGERLPMLGHHRKYIEEKMSCIFSRGVLIEG